MVAVGCPRQGSNGEGEMSSDAESSVASVTDCEDIEKAAVDLYGEDNGVAESVPEHGIIFNASRCTVHKAREQGDKSCCGWTFRLAAAKKMMEWPTTKYTLCRKDGCFVEGA